MKIPKAKPETKKHRELRLNLIKRMKSDPIRTKEMEDFEKKWGTVCPKCKLRKGTFMASKNAEGGRSNTCKCDEK